jgi:hypothetical protein
VEARRPWVFSVLVSLAAAVVAAVWLAEPAAYPFGSGSRVQAGVNQLIERDVGAVLLLVFAAAGIGLAAVALRGGASPAGRRLLRAGAAAEAAFFAFVLSDASLISTTGYALALASPLVAATLLVLAGRRWRPVGLALAVLVPLAGVVGVTTGVLGEAAATFGTYVGNVAEGFGAFGSRIAWSWGMAAAAAVWAWAALGWLRGSSSPDRAEAAARWGRRATIAAALCPVPYGLLRLTWLTPWPLGGADEFVISGMTAAQRLQGLMFVPACVVGIVLTLGLISRWGEVFPRWVPALAGRPVPVAVAVVPGLAVAAILTISGPGLAVGPLESGDLAEAAVMLFFFPFPVWGPLLGAAVLAYWLRRAAAPATPAPTVAVPGVSLPQAS